MSTCVTGSVPPLSLYSIFSEPPKWRSSIAPAPRAITVAWASISVSSAPLRVSTRLRTSHRLGLVRVGGRSRAPPGRGTSASVCSRGEARQRNAALIQGLLFSAQATRAGTTPGSVVSNPPLCHDTAALSILHKNDIGRPGGKGLIAGEGFRTLPPGQRVLHCEL